MICNAQGITVVSIRDYDNYAKNIDELASMKL